jgi:hypothetical protein
VGDGAGDGEATADEQAAAIRQTAMTTEQMRFIVLLEEAGAEAS